MFFLLLLLYRLTAAHCLCINTKNCLRDVREQENFVKSERLGFFYDVIQAITIITHRKNHCNSINSTLLTSVSCNYFRIMRYYSIACRTNANYSVDRSNADKRFFSLKLFKTKLFFSLFYWPTDGWMDDDVDHNNFILWLGEKRNCCCCVPKWGRERRRQRQKWNEINAGCWRWIFSWEFYFRHLAF